MKYGKGRSERHAEFMKPHKGFNSPEGELMHGKKETMNMDIFAAQKQDLHRLQMLPAGHRGYPYEAFEYQY